MATIYEPKGKAREYSPLAVNHYTGCDHECEYCYVPSMFKRFNQSYEHNKVVEKKDFIKKLENDCLRVKEKKQVLLSFTGDPYCKKNDEIKLTREVLKVLLKNDFPVAILSKGGNRILQDIDIFQDYSDKVKVGCTLTFDKKIDSQQWEKSAALPSERIDTLNKLKKAGIKTWVSFEPVIEPSQVLKLIQKTNSFVDYYKVGKLNHYKQIESQINWAQFAEQAIGLFRKYGNQFYIKKDLAKFCPEGLLQPNEVNQDYVN